MRYDINERATFLDLHLFSLHNTHTQRYIFINVSTIYNVFQKAQ